MIHPIMIDPQPRMYRISSAGVFECTFRLKTAPHIDNSWSQVIQGRTDNLQVLLQSEHLRLPRHSIRYFLRLLFTLVSVSRCDNRCLAPCQPVNRQMKTFPIEAAKIPLFSRIKQDQTFQRPSNPGNGQPRATAGLGEKLKMSR